MAYPYMKTDGGRSQSKRPKQRNDCTVIALAVSASLTYDAAYDIVASRGRKCAEGYWFPFGFKTIRSGPMPEAGVRFDWISYPAVKYDRREHIDSFARSHKKGVFVLRLSKHVCAVVDGVVHDTHRTYDERCVYGAWKVTKL